MFDNVALVFGGGGAAGNALMIGIIAGLAEGGLDLTKAADPVIGTSSGANAAAQVRSGISPAELLAAFVLHLALILTSSTVSAHAEEGVEALLGHDEERVTK
ncbi:MAG TPA: hypothetical protein VHV26_13865 [Rhizomicrobium sp.]|nr:hypothetical protein [Rhizomicrobium sp.]